MHPKIPEVKMSSDAGKVDWDRPWLENNSDFGCHLLNQSAVRVNMLVLKSQFARSSKKAGGPKRDEKVMKKDTSLQVLKTIASSAGRPGCAVQN